MKKSIKKFALLLLSYKAILSLGCNLGNRKLSLVRAVAQLQKRLQETQVSSIYETSPVDSDPQRNQSFYYNLVMSGMTSMTPRELLQFTQEVEASVTAQSINDGFPPHEKRDKGPRYLDIDIIFLGEMKFSDSNILIPHPSYRDRLFVMIPLLEIEPDWHDFVSGEKISEIITTRDFTGQEITKLK